MPVGDDERDAYHNAIRTCDSDYHETDICVLCDREFLVRADQDAGICRSCQELRVGG